MLHGTTPVIDCMLSSTIHPWTHIVHLDRLNKVDRDDDDDDDCDDDFNGDDNDDDDDDEYDDVEDDDGSDDVGVHDDEKACLVCVTNYASFPLNSEEQGED